MPEPIRSALVLGLLAAATPQITTSAVFTSLPAFTNPVAMKQAPGDDTRWFVAEKSGVIRVFANNMSSSSSSIFFDISANVASAGEGGLLGFAFHPDFPTTPEVLVSFTRGGPFRSFVSRFYSTDNGQTLSPLVEDVLIVNPQPATNHNGGDIAFGPDGFLYVGQNAWEEIDLVENGENYGWNDREGAHCYDPASGCADTFREPHAEYAHALGSSVTGGFVYRGNDIPDLVAWYLFGDFASGRIFAFEVTSMAGVTPDELLDSGLSIVSFAEDINGEPYVLDHGVGTIHKLESAP